MTLREKLMHYTNDLGDVDLKQEAIATIEHIAQYMDEDELLHHSRPLALAYLALTEDDSVPVVHGRWVVRFDGPYKRRRCYCSHCGKHNGVGGIAQNQEKPYCPNCGTKMDGGADNG